MEHARRVFIGLPGEGERALVVAPPAGSWCTVLAADGSLVLKPHRPLKVGPGERVVVRRLKGGQEFFFEEAVLGTRPLTLTLSMASVTRMARKRVAVPAKVVLGGSEVLDGVVRDASPGGLKVAVWRPLPVGGEVAVLAGGERAACEVRGCFPWTGGWWYAGLAFREGDALWRALGAGKDLGGGR